MSALHEPSLLARTARWWRNWLGNRAAEAELARLGSGELADLARDVGASSSDLQALAGKWPESADLLTRRMSLLGLDRAEVARTEPAVARDLGKLCSLCRDKSRCEHDLDAGGVNPAWRRYCPNSLTLLALATERSAKRSEGH